MWKKILRTLSALLPVDRRRTGACKACGACCQLVFRCPFLTYNAEGVPRCRIYRFRPPACRKYPRTPFEWVTQDTCGYSFTPEAQPASEPHPAPQPTLAHVTEHLGQVPAPAAE